MVSTKIGLLLVRLEISHPSKQFHRKLTTISSVISKIPSNFPYYAVVKIPLKIRGSNVEI